MQTNGLKEFERHRDYEQVNLFHIEMLDHEKLWTQCHTQDFKKDGKFILFHPDFAALFRTKEVGSELKFMNQSNAENTAKMLAHIVDRPLRIVRIQHIRLQKKMGKIILPVGGV